MSNQVYGYITDKIMEELERGCVPWHKPWKSPDGGSKFFKPIRGQQINSPRFTSSFQSYNASTLLEPRDAIFLLLSILAVPISICVHR